MKRDQILFIIFFTPAVAAFALGQTHSAAVLAIGPILAVVIWLFRKSRIFEVIGKVF